MLNDGHNRLRLGKFFNRIIETVILFFLILTEIAH